MTQQYSIRHANRDRESFEPYEYEILDGTELVACYWHDYRGDDHGVRFMDGTEDCPVGRNMDFLTGGGPEPLALSKAAIAWLSDRLAK